MVLPTKILHERQEEEYQNHELKDEMHIVPGVQDKNAQKR